MFSLIEKRQGGNMPAKLARIAAVTATLLISALSIPAADGQPADGKVRILILSGANNHSWQTTTPALKKMYEDSGRFTVDVTDNVPALKGEDFAKYDVLVSNYTTYPTIDGKRWPAETEKAFLDYISSGHGFALFHAASTAWNDWPEFISIIGLSWIKGKSGHGAQHPFTVNIIDREHPVTSGMKDFVHIKDELYHHQTLHPSAKILASTFSDKAMKGSGTNEPMITATEYGKGRIFHNAMGHDPKSMACTSFQTLMLRGTEWAATGKVTIKIPTSEWAEPGSEKAEELKKPDPPKK